MTASTTAPKQSKSDRIAASVLPSLKATPNQTAKDLGVTLVDMYSLVEAGLVRKTNVRKHSQNGQASRGRPSFEFALARKGTDRLRRQAKKAAQSA